MSGSLILALDGSTGPCSVALLELGAESVGSSPRPVALSVRSVQDSRAHARMLLLLADESLKEVGAVPRDLRAVVVGTGPGTFTGVRVTVATARGIGLALDIPVLGVSTLSALVAWAVGAPTAAVERRSWKLSDVIVPVVDARRGQLFYSAYAPCGRGDPDSWRRLGEIGVCSPESLPERLAGLLKESVGIDSDLGRETWVIGEPTLLAGLPRERGIGMVATDVSAEWLVMGQPALEEPERPVGGIALARWLLRTVAQDTPWSAQGLPAGALGTPESVVPIYVRAPDADLHITKMRDPWSDREDREFRGDSRGRHRP